MTRIESSKKKVRFVKQMRFHIGVQIPGTVKNSLDVEKDNAEMELWGNGVLAKVKGVEIFVPLANIHYAELIKEE
jgi:hypothetical protein